MGGELKANFKITINGKEYRSLDEIPEQFRHLIKDGLKQGMKQALSGSGQSRFTFKKAIKFKIGQDELPVELQELLRSPEEFRRLMGTRQSGPVPAASVFESLLNGLLWLAIAAICMEMALLVSGKSSLPLTSPNLMALVIAFAPTVLGLVWLWTRRQRRDLYAVLQELAGQIHGAFVILESGNPRLYFAREAWNGAVSFRIGSNHNPAFSRLDAQTRPSGARLNVRSRVLSDRIIGLFRAKANVTGDADFDRRFVISTDNPDLVPTLLDSVLCSCLSRLGGFGKVALDINGNLVRTSVERNLSVLHRKSRRDRDVENLRSFLTDATTIMDSVARRAPESAPPPASAQPPAAAVLGQETV